MDSRFRHHHVVYHVASDVGNPMSVRCQFRATGPSVAGIRIEADEPVPAVPIV